jgi:hypothetical protein
MSGDFNLETDDLVLFFADKSKEGNPVVNRWLPKAVYAAENLQRRDADMDAVAQGWRGALVTETLIGASAWDLANLNRLKTQDSGPAQMPPEISQTVKDAINAVAPAQRPGADDLVIVPYAKTDTTAKGCLLTRDVYYNCPALPDDLVADLQYLAVEDGVVLANVPKPEPFGVSCIVLGLNNLRSSALPGGAPDNADKTTVARLARNQL